MLFYSTKSVDVLTTYKNTKKDKQKYAETIAIFRQCWEYFFIKIKMLHLVWHKKHVLQAICCRQKKKFINVLRKLDTV